MKRTTLSHYRIIRKIGAGGMGEVYLAEDTRLDRHVALKILPSEFAPDRERKRRFLQEAKAAAALNHPNVATVYEVDEAGGVYFIAMEYVDGAPLTARISRGAFEIEDLRKIAVQILDALIAAHTKGIVHRDLKPANIMITDRGQVKLVDFGLAKRVVTPDDKTIEAATIEGGLLGTVGYFSPEQALGKPVDHRSDIFSLGVVLYEMATGSLPFAGENAIDTINRIINAAPDPINRVEVPSWLQSIIHRCLQKAVHQRYQSAEEVLAAVTGRSVEAPAAGLHFQNNLPRQLTNFIGRDKEIEQVRDAIVASRLVTLTGAGGIGKTRLALQVANKQIERYVDGVCFVDLAPLSDPALVPQSVASVVNVREEPGKPLIDALAEYLKARGILLILDNCEHLAAACGHMAYRLLTHCPDLHILATSRQPLGVVGETVWNVAPLSETEAVRMFLERATAVQPSFKIDDDNRAAVSQLCLRLDGIPLAIELAVVRLKILSIQQINERLEDRFRLLISGSATSAPRQQTLRATLDWSYRLLSDKERIVLDRLSVFAGGWTLEAAERTCAGKEIDEYDVLDLLSRLADKSLVIINQDRSGVRFRLLETVRQYAQEMLAARGDGEDVRRLHMRFFLNFIQQAESKPNRQETTWLDKIQIEHDNLRAALVTALEADCRSSLLLVHSLWKFWSFRGYYVEARKWLDQALSQPGAAELPAEYSAVLIAAADCTCSQGEYVNSRARSEEAMKIGRQLQNPKLIGDALLHLSRSEHLRGEYDAERGHLLENLAIHKELKNQAGIAVALSRLGDVARLQNDYASARSLLGESLAIQRGLGDKGSIGSTLNRLGSVLQYQGDYAGATPLLEESLAISEQLGDKPAAAKVLGNLANLAIFQKEYARARPLLEKSSALLRESGDRRGIAITLLSLGVVNQYEGDLQSARMRLEESIAICRGLGDEFVLSAGLVNLADVVRLQKDFTVARSLIADALKIQLKLGRHEDIAYSFENLACIAVAQDQHERAARLWGAAETIRKNVGCPLPPNAQDDYRQGVAAALSKLGEETFGIARAEGSAMSVEQALAYARDEGLGK